MSWTININERTESGLVGSHSLVIEFFKSYFKVLVQCYFVAHKLKQLKLVIVFMVHTTTIILHCT